MTRLGHKLNYVLNTFVKRTPGHLAELDGALKTEFTKMKSTIFSRDGSLMLFVNVRQILGPC